MADQQNSNRLPLLVGILAVILLAGAGAYLLMGKQNVDNSADTAAKASSDAKAAVAAAGMSAKDRAATEALVRAYILEHPEVITDAVEILQQRDVAKRLAAVGDSLRKPFPGAEAGNPSGDITVVEFTDYSCGYCRASVADVNKLISTDKGIRVIYRELPILSPDSEQAALWGLAAAKQGKHKAFHDAMFAIGHPNAENIRAAAARAGLDIAAAQKFIASPEANAEIDSNLAMMRQIGFSGTPTFIVGNQILQGAQGHEGLRDAVAKARGSH